MTHTLTHSPKKSDRMYISIRVPLCVIKVYYSKQTRGLGLVEHIRDCSAIIKLICIKHTKCVHILLLSNDQIRRV